MTSSVVFKIKHEDTLRRFNVSVNEDRHLDLNMEGLRVKICSLFNLPSSANFSLTYRDEDDDFVTLVDDEDLHDVVRQGLNPVRITVSLKTDTTAQTSTTSSASSIPRGSFSQNPQQNVNPNVVEVLKSVPEPLRHALSKLSTDLTSKAASTCPVLADFLDDFSKIGQSYLNGSPSVSATVNVSSRAEGCDDSKQNAKNGKGDASTDEGVKHNDVQTSRPVQQSPKSAQGIEAAEFLPPPHAFYPEGQYAKFRPSSRLPHYPSTNRNKEVIEDSAAKSGAYGQCHAIKCSKGSLKKRVSSEKEAAKTNLGGSRGSFLGGSSSKSYFDTDPAGECPFSGVGMHESYELNPLQPPPPPVQPIYVGGMGSIFHRGVRCDGCGVNPITGPRFKSKVKHNYDLCSICFERMGNYVDYGRIDYPLPYRHPSAFKSFYDPGLKVLRARPVPVPLTMRRPDAKQLRSRHDSRFIMDVNVLDGTMMAPLTPFTKIWRIRNNGTLPWHRGLQLLWIGGDRFNSSDSVEIEIPVDGVNVGQEIDIAVDFIAPELPGRYISYWRMAEPSGHKFGQRVWVLIEVDASADLTRESSPGLNLNLPPETTEASGPQVLDLNGCELKVEAGDLRSPSMLGPRLELEIEDLNFPINNDLLVPSDVLCPTSAAASSSATPAIDADNGVLLEASLISNPDGATNLVHESPSAPPAVLYPIIDMSNGSSASSIANNDNPHLPDQENNEKKGAVFYPIIDMSDGSSASSIAKNDNPNHLEQENNEKKDFEATLLKELEEMGFKQVDLNKEVLRVNEYDLERSVDELCGVSEWDPMLEELKEMGFEDNETNKKLLAKNNGSITRVVMDLIAGEKA